MGEGVPKDSSLAVKWFSKAAEQGNANAQFNLGYMYQMGEGVPKNASLAAQWYRKAAEQGVANAQFNLGLMYANGEGVPKDASLAVQWFSKAAVQGNANAQNTLGVMYEKGEGVAKNYTLAYAWYNIAAANGDTRFAPGNRNNLEKKMSKAEVTEAQRLSSSWKLGSNIELDNSIDQSSGLALLASYNKNMPGILPDFHTGGPTSPITGDPMSDDEVINWLCNYGNEVFQLTNLDAYKIPIQEFLNSPRAKKCAYERQQNN